MLLIKLKILFTQLQRGVRTRELPPWSRHWDTGSLCSPPFKYAPVGEQFLDEFKSIFSTTTSPLFFALNNLVLSNRIVVFLGTHVPATSVFAICAIVGLCQWFSVEISIENYIKLSFFYCYERFITQCTYREGPSTSKFPPSPCRSWPRRSTSDIASNDWSSGVQRANPRVNKPPPPLCIRSPPPYLGCAVWTAFRSYGCACAAFARSTANAAKPHWSSEIEFRRLGVFTCRCSIVRRPHDRCEENHSCSTTGVRLGDYPRTRVVRFKFMKRKKLTVN